MVRGVIEGAILSISETDGGEREAVMTSAVPPLSVILREVTTILFPSQNYRLDSAYQIGFHCAGMLDQGTTDV